MSRRPFPTPHLGLLGVALGVFVACDDTSEKPLPAVSSATPGAGQPGKPTLPEELHSQREEPSEEVTQEVELPPHPGPWFVVTAGSTGLYEKTSFDKAAKFGYARSGGRLPVLAKPVSTDDCSSGWYQLVPSGFVCGNSGTTDEKSSALKFAQKPPNLEEVLPYKYARNAKNGTPLYRSIPSREQMYEYEPYLEGAKKQKLAEQKAKETTEQVLADTSRGNGRGASDDVDVKTAASDVAPGPANTGTIRVSEQKPAYPGQAIFEGDEAGVEPAEPEVPWWQAEDAKERLHEVTLEALQEEADGILVKRLVTGFYVAVDKTFSWNGRTWYKTTRGLVAPADRFWQTEGSEFKGVELGEQFKLPVGWVYGGRKSTTSYRIAEDESDIEPEGTIERFEAIQLTGETKKYRGTDYHQTQAGLWVKSRHLRITEPGDVPEELQAGERWIDVNLSRQTLVAFEGETPKYATLISSGKKSSIKEKDHRTPTGRWRIRVKHLTDTMDGDGTVAGDLPYSIEDVPYVMYFHKAYALHAAFWHRNYGVEMSHGCINLAPLDAKHLFLFAGPHLVEGSHGAWSSAERPGSLVQVHE